MAPRPRPALSTKATGLLLALAFTLIAAGVVLFFVIRSRPQLPTGPAAVVPPPPPSAKVTDVAEFLQSTGKARIQSVDKSDPNRIANELEWQSLQPAGKGYSDLDQPRAWIYLKDGRTFHVQAARGRVRLVTMSQPPESGRFEGGVIATLYPAPTPLSDGSPARPINPEIDTPSLMFATGSLSFTTDLGELSTMDPVSISTPDYEFQGVGMRVAFNQVLERLELLEIERGELIRYSPPAPATAAAPDGGGTPEASGSKAASAAKPGGPAPAPGATGATARVKEDYYRAVFSDDVKVAQQGQTISADTLQVWAHLVNNALAVNAVAAGSNRSSPVLLSGVPAGSTPGPRPPGPSVIPAAFSAPRTPPTLTRSSDHDVVLTWTGSLVIKPVETRPAELATDEVALRFTAERTGNVLLADEARKATGRCAVIDYGATLRQLALTSLGTQGVTLTLADSGRFRIGRIEVNLGTGTAHVPGPGTLSSPAVPSDADAARSITWSDQADFQFGAAETPAGSDATAVAGGIGGSQSVVREAMFTGSVVAKDQRSTLSGDFLHASFVPTPKQPSSLSRLIVDGNVAAETIGRDGSDAGSLRAQRLDVAFQPSDNPENPDPTVLTATGAVAARQKDATLHSDFLEAHLARDDKRNIIVTDATARTKVRFDRADGVSATTEELRIDAPKQVADLVGDGSTVSHTGSTVTAAQMHLDGVKRDLFVHGPGMFDHRETRAAVAAGGTAEQASPARIHAAWATSMHFDDLAGLIDCLGNVSVTSTPDAMSTDAAKGERLRISLTPGLADSGRSIALVPNAALDDPAGREGAPATGPSAHGSAQARRVLSAHVFGSILERPDGTVAKVESRRYIPDPAAAAGSGGRRLERLLYVEGPSVLADDQSGAMSVPGPGLAIVLDQRSKPDTLAGADARKPATDAPFVPTQGSDLRGTSRFIWAESMNFNRNSGVLDLRRSVRLTHKPLNDDPTTELECEWLQATLQPRDAGAAPDSASVTPSSQALARGSQLVRAIARDAVYLTTGRADAMRELIADVLEYDAIAGTAQATAAEGNRVTLFDSKKPSPIVASRLFWDMVHDRIKVDDLAPVVLPR